MFAPTIRHIEENLQILNGLKTRLSDSINKLSALKQLAEKEGKSIKIQATPIQQKQGLTLELLEDVEPDTDLHFDQRVVDAKKNLEEIETQLAYLTDDSNQFEENHTQHIYYIANILMVVYADQEIQDEEMDVVREVVKDLHATEQDLQTAKELVESGNYYLHRIGSYSDQIRILEDMFRACFSDGNIDPRQKELIENFAGSMGIRQERMDQIQEWLPERIIRH